jgi:dTDP-4-dehydrorhamnose 3,5-epimerase
MEMDAERLQSQQGQWVQGPLLLTPRLFGDARGFFQESWNQTVFTDLLQADGQGMVPTFVQDNHSRSSQGVLRGLHYQVAPHAQGKLVRCVVGEIFDVAVDLRRSSPTFGQWVGARLSAHSQQQMWVPPGFAHGFLSVSQSVDVLYKTTDFWTPACERGLRWDDPDLAIAWPLEALQGVEVQLAAKDAEAPLWRRAQAAGDLWP